MAHIVPLTTEDNKALFVKKEWLYDIQKELDDFCNSSSCFNNVNFPREVLFPHELKNNNAIEGYYEDLSSIIKITNNPYVHHDNIDFEYQRIRNLFQGYKYILNNPDINKKSLKELYTILSKHLLNPDEKVKDGNFYRDNDVYIFFSDNMLVPPDVGFDKDNIEQHMNELFDYINNNDNLSEIELFFKSQIIHFYMLFIHPYFDINGRTARTTSLWFLNNNGAYPYTIFNRAITYNKISYYKVTREVKVHRNLTPFIDFVAKGTKIELEKEYVIRNIENNSGYTLTPIDKQMLQYIISNNSQNSLIDIQNIYNRFNPRCTLKEINEELLASLFEKNIIIKKRNTHKMIYNGGYNYIFEFNDSVLDFDKSKIKRLSI